MTLLCDVEIDRLARLGMIEPYIDHKEQNEGRGPSYGLSSFGYDIRLADEWRFPARTDEVLDPAKPDGGIAWGALTGEEGLILAGKSILARSLEYIRMPPDVMGVVMGKSTLARCFLTLNTTMIEPGWEGHITLEISNLGSNSVRLTAGMGVGQLVFYRGEMPAVGYVGRYQGQTGVTGPRVYESERKAA